MRTTLQYKLCKHFVWNFEILIEFKTKTIPETLKIIHKTNQNEFKFNFLTSFQFHFHHKLTCFIKTSRDVKPIAKKLPWPFRRRCVWAGKWAKEETIPVLSPTTKLFFFAIFFFREFSALISDLWEVAKSGRELEKLLYFYLKKSSRKVFAFWVAENKEKEKRSQQFFITESESQSEWKEPEKDLNKKIHKNCLNEQTQKNWRKWKICE